MFGKEIDRRKFLTMSGMAGAALLGASGCGSAGGGGGESGSSGSKSLTLGDIGWAEGIAINNVVKVLLEDNYDYKVSLQLADEGPLWKGVASGDLDAFLDAWLPYTSKSYWEEYKDELIRLDPWYTGASIGLAVPNYTEPQTIGDLSQYRSEFNGEIVGIEPGAGEMTIVKDEVIPQYGLDYTLQGSSTPSMLSAVESATESEQPIVFTAWKPHWMSPRTL